ncbi:MAG: hypothetical protein JST30_12360 [Armatimonadetes bacterium]|nr:hypothetical protein [Armatimonadota bacterium]
MRKPLFSLLAVVAAAFAQADMIAITRTGDVIEVDPTTGASHVLFATHLTVNSLAATGATYHTVSNGRLYRINVNNQTATAGANLNAGSNDVRGFAIDSNGTGWAVIDDGGVDSLWKIDLSSGMGTDIGTIGFDKVQGLDCDSKGRLFAYDIDQGLIRVSRADGHGWDLDTDVVGTNLQSIAFDDQDNLFGTSDKLYKIKPTSGSLSLIGGALGDVRGVEVPTSPLYNVIPSSLVVKLGKTTSLFAQHVREDDGVGLVVCKFVVPNASTPPIQVEVTGHSPFTLLDGMQLLVRQRMNSGGLYKSFIDVMNFQTGKFVNVADLTVGSSYKTDTIDVPGFLDDLVSPTHDIVMRYRVRATGPTAVQLYCHDMDWVAWFLTPRIL